MPRINDIHSFIVPAETADLTNYVFTEIIGGINGCQMYVNGVFYDVSPQTNVNVRINSLSANTGCWVGGEKKNVFTGNGYLDDNNNNIDYDYIDDYIDDYF